MKKAIIAIAILACTGAASPATAQQKGSTTKTKTTTKVKQYTCPMHPEVVQEKPGDCPKCGMKLVAKKQSKKK